jgi:hypothetical protein
MQYNFKCYSIPFSHFFSLFHFFSPSPPPFTSLSLDGSTPPTIASLSYVFVCGSDDERGFSAVAFIVRPMQRAGFVSVLPHTDQTGRHTNILLVLPCLVPFFLFSVHFETATLRGRSSPAEPRKGFRIYDYFLSGISGSLIIPPMAGSNNNNNKKTTCWRGWTFHFVWLLN